MGVHPQLRRYPLVFVSDLNSPELDDRDVHHLIRSLRLGRGDELNVSDGQGRWAPAHLIDSDGRVERIGDVVTEAQPQPAVSVGFVPTKGVKPESVVHRLTELGVDRIVILRSARSVVVYDPQRTERLLRRLSVTVREAGQQSRQPTLPSVEGVLTLPELRAGDPGLVLFDPAGTTLDSLVSPANPTLTVAVGPEGGWDESELRYGRLASLPGRILRAETAAVAAGVVAAALRSG